MKIQECVFDKIEEAYNEFKEEMLKLEPEEMFEKSYKIACIIEIFDMLFDSYEFTPEQAQIILDFKGNILEQVYDDWLNCDSSWRDDFEQSIDRTLVLLDKVVSRYAS